MTEPTTKAGRALLDHIDNHFEWRHDMPNPYRPTWVDGILAIEAEARQQAAASLDLRALMDAAEAVWQDAGAESHWFAHTLITALSGEDGPKIAAAYAEAVKGGEQTPSDTIRGAGGGQTASSDPDVSTK